MKPLPPVGELLHFQGDSITQIKLDPHGVQFQFESGWRLDARDDIQHLDREGTIWFYDGVAADGPPLVLHRLLYKPITAIDRQELSLTFNIEDGSCLTIFSEICPYESGVFWAPDGSYIVF
jgi:hypothetical protein